VTREVFRQVFALTLTEVASLESHAWSEIQDRLIGGMGARDLVPARSVADALETEAQRLWRPSRRGGQEIRVLRERIRVARAARSEALQADHVVRESMRELEQASETLRAARVEREQQRLLIERITQLLPIRERMDQAAKLEAEAGPPGVLDDLPADPSAERQRLVAEVAALGDRIQRMQAEAEEPRARLEAFSSEHRAILDARRGIEEITSAAGASGPVSSRLSTIDQEVRDRQCRIVSETPKIFERALTSREESTLGTLVLPDLHDRVRDANAARDRVREHALRRTLGALPEASRRTLIAGLAAGVAAVVLLSLPVDVSWARGIAVVLALAASMTLARWWTLRQARRGGGESASSDEGSRLAQESEAAVALLGSFLSGLPVRSDVLAEAGSEFVATVTRLQELLEEIDTRARETEEAKATLQGTADRLTELGHQLGIELPPASPAAIHVLQTQLREAERAQEASKGASAEFERLSRREAERKAELASRTEALQSLDQVLHALGGENVEDAESVEAIEAKLRAAMRMRRAREKAMELRADLEQSHPNLDDLVGRLAELDDVDGGQGGDEALAEAKIRVEELSDRIEALPGQVKDLQNKYERAAERPTADQIDGEIDALENEARRLEHEHDRKIILAHAVRQADHRFREDHQPDVVRIASSYLATVTDDRYDRIMVSDSGEFQVRRSCKRGKGTARAVEAVEADGAAKTAGATVAAHDLSTGAREQLYLAMRLAIMSHLDNDLERLPVFIDEALVNWDAARRRRGFQLLHELSQTRQVFVMTCHEPWAEELVDAGANRVNLL
jgi:DNA repair exonuclease SbcCD ATPase subunit